MNSTLLTIQQLWASWGLMAVRYALIAIGSSTTATADSDAPKVFGAITVLATLAWGLWAKAQSRKQKIALGAADPAAVTVK